MPPLVHGELDAEGGNFSSGSSMPHCFIPWGNQIFGQRRWISHDRYLDPPVLNNYTNRGNAGGLSVSYERDFSTSDRLFVS